MELTDLVETYRAHIANESYPGDDGPLDEAHSGQCAALLTRILDAPIVVLADGPAKISVIFMSYDGAVIDKEAQAMIIGIAQSMERLAGEAQS